MLLSRSSFHLSGAWTLRVHLTKPPPASCLFIQAVRSLCTTWWKGNVWERPCRWLFIFKISGVWEELLASVGAFWSCCFHPETWSILLVAFAVRCVEIVSCSPEQHAKVWHNALWKLKTKWKLVCTSDTQAWQLSMVLVVWLPAWPLSICFKFFTFLLTVSHSLLAASY